MSFNILNENWNKPSISDKYEELSHSLKKVLQEIENLREECPHTNIEVITGSDTGNWDRGDDCYWIDWRCQDCGDFGRVYNDSPLYKGMLKHV